MPRSFRALDLGMDMESLKKTLLEDGEFDFNGDADVSFLPLRKERVVDVSGGGFIKRAFFQLTDVEGGEGGSSVQNVFIMSFILNDEKIDHYSVFTNFVEKYGEPKLMNPKLALWEDEATRIYIERPLTVKYVDKAVFDAAAAAGETLKSKNAVLRDDFLSGF